MAIAYHLATRLSPNRRSDMKRAPLAPADYIDPVIEVYMKDVDRTLLRENLKLSVQERLEKLMSFTAFLDEVRKGSPLGPHHEP